jgi:hypothetical protein
MTNSFTESSTAISKWRRREGEAGYTQPSGHSAGHSVSLQAEKAFSHGCIQSTKCNFCATLLMTSLWTESRKAFGRKRKRRMLAWLCGTALCAFQCSSVVGEFLDSLEPYQESGLPSVVMSFRIGPEGNGPGGKSPYCNK